MDENEGSNKYNSKLEPRMGSSDSKRDECVCVSGGGGVRIGTGLSLQIF